MLICWLVTVYCGSFSTSLFPLPRCDRRHRIGGNVEMKICFSLIQARQERQAIPYHTMTIATVSALRTRVCDASDTSEKNERASEEKYRSATEVNRTPEISPLKNVSAFQFKNRDSPIYQEQHLTSEMFDPIFRVFH